MRAEPEDPSYSALQVRRPEAQRIGSGIGTTDAIRAASLPSPSSHSRGSLTKGLPELPSPEFRRPDSGLVVTSPPQVTAPSSYGSSESCAKWITEEKKSELPASRAWQRTICSFRPRFWVSLIASTVVIAIVISAAVGVTVRNAKHNASLQASPLSPVSTSVPTSNDTSSGLSSETGLASVAWNDTSGKTQHRVYYQDADNFIRESSWDVMNLTWVQMSDPIGQAKPNTPIAAAVASSTTFRFQINVYALGTENEVLQWFTNGGTNWEIGPLTRTKIASNLSGLAAIWHGYEGCFSCPHDFLLVYQSNNGKFQLGNATMGVSWQWSELQANPILGSGISMALFWWPNATAGVRLFYQLNNSRMVSLDWDVANQNRPDVTNRWALKENIHLATLPSKAPIASFTWGTVPSGVPRILDTLSPGLGGITVNVWAGIKNAWVNAVSPVAMKGAQNSSIAANNNALAYAIMNNTIWEFALKPNNRRWVLTGKVWP